MFCPDRQIASPITVQAVIHKVIANVFMYISTKSGRTQPSFIETAMCNTSHIANFFQELPRFGNF